MFLSSGDGYVGELLVLPQGCQKPFQGSRGKVEFLSERVPEVPAETPQGKEASSHIEGRISWFYSSWGKEIGVPLKLQRGPLGTRSCSLRKARLHVNCEGPHTVLSRINVQLGHGPSAEATAPAPQPSKLDERPRQPLGGHGRAGLAGPFPVGRFRPRGGPCPPRRTQPPRRALGRFRHPGHKDAFPRSRCRPRGWTLPSQAHPASYTSSWWPRACQPRQSFPWRPRQSKCNNQLSLAHPAS